MDYITPKDYWFGYPDHPEITNEHRARAAALLVQVNRLLAAALRAGVTLAGNPIDGSLMSRYTAADINAGWRPQSCPIGAPKSPHKEARAVDIYDPQGELDTWLTDDILRAFGLYREDPGSTRGWVHLTDRAPKSGKRTFYP